MKISTAAAATALGFAISHAATVRAEAIGQNFTSTTVALNFFTGDGVEPPDTMGAVGANYFAQFINGNYSVFNKSNGAAIVNIADVDFWSNAGLTNFDTLSDPRIIYDHATKRWFASMIDFTVDENTGLPGADNNFLLAVSKTSNPTGPWTGFRFAANPANSGLLADFPRLGLNATNVYLASDNFSPTDNETTPPTNVTIVSILKSDLLAATPTVDNRTMLFSLAPSSVGTAIQPVVDFGPSSGKGILVSVDGINFGTLDRINVLNPTTTPTLAPTVHITVPMTSAPPTAQQQDTPNNIETNDDRISAHVFQVGNSLWATQESGDGTRFPRSQIRWYQIDATTNTLAQPGGVIGDSTHDYYYPSIAANGYGDVVIGFTRSSSTEYASAYCVVGSTDPVSHVTTFGAPVLLHAGIAAYDAAALGVPNRWGDYSATRVDPADPWIFWTIQEWADYSEDPDFGFPLPTWSLQVAEIIITKAGESRWDTPTNGTFGNTAAWLQGAAPGAATHAIFSRATDPAGSGYTVSFTAGATTDRLSVRQGVVTFDLGGHIYSVTNTATTATPSFIVGEFGGEPRVTITNGTLSTHTTFIAPGATSDAAVTLTGSGTSWLNAGALYVGASDAGAGGIGVLNVTNSAVLNTTSMTIGPSGTVNTDATLIANTITNNGTFAQSTGAASAGQFLQNGGIALIGGTLTTTSGLTLNGGILAGHGTIAGTVSAGAGAHTIAPSVTLSPTSTGVLTVTSLTTNSNTTLAFNLVTPNTNGGSDTVNVLGTNGLTLGSGTVVQIANHTTGIPSLGYYKLIGYSGTIGGGVTNLTGLPGDVANVNYQFDINHDANFIDVHRGFMGDANDSGTVEFNDFLLLSQNFGKTGGWSVGNFLADATVDFNDFLVLSQNFGKSITSFGGEADFSSLTPDQLAQFQAFFGSAPADVPEPASLALLGMGAVMLLARRRR